jgi:hypothetical protein
VLFALLLIESNAVASDILSKTVMVVVVVRFVKLSNSYSQLVILAWQRSSIIVVVAMQ